MKPHHFCYSCSCWTDVCALCLLLVILLMFQFFNFFQLYATHDFDNFFVFAAGDRVRTHAPPPPNSWQILSKFSFNFFILRLGLSNSKCCNSSSFFSTFRSGLNWIRIFIFSYRQFCRMHFTARGRAPGVHGGHSGLGGGDRPGHGACEPLPLHGFFVGIELVNAPSWGRCDFIFSSPFAKWVEKLEESIDGVSVGFFFGTPDAGAFLLWHGKIN